MLTYLILKYPQKRSSGGAYISGHLNHWWQLKHVLTSKIHYLEWIILSAPSQYTYIQNGCVIGFDHKLCPHHNGWGRQTMQYIGAYSTAIVNNSSIDPLSTNIPQICKYPILNYLLTLRDAVMQINNHIWYHMVPIHYPGPHPCWILSHINTRSWNITLYMTVDESLFPYVIFHVSFNT